MLDLTLALYRAVISPDQHIRRWIQAQELAISHSANRLIAKHSRA
jgi:hypothetical protein